ncbi:MAG: type II secretion system protein [Opitutaceae bacterium]|nr:type II secretion system protein [Opitutaceae bacterium]
MKSINAFTLIEMMIVMVLAGMAIAVLAPEVRSVLGRGKDSKAAQIQDTLQNWYIQWTTSGGVHNSTATDQAAMANYLLTVASSAPNDAGTAHGSGDIWVDETQQMINGKSLPGAIRIEARRPFAMNASGQCVIDTDYAVTFDPKGSSNRGAFTVTVLTP